MTYNELVTIFFDRSDALSGLWTIYITVAGALLGFCASRDRVGPWTLTILSAAFVLFSIANLSGMKDTAKQRFAIRDALVAYNTTEEEKLRGLESFRAKFEATLDPAPYEGATGLRTYHVTFTTLTLCGLWVISYRKAKRRR